VIKAVKGFFYDLRHGPALDRIKNQTFPSLMLPARRRNGAVSRHAGSRIVGISAFDPIAFVAAPLFVLVIAGAASVVPRTPHSI
jgi:hypothetical protein